MNAILIYISYLNSVKGSTHNYSQNYSQAPVCRSPWVASFLTGTPYFTNEQNELRILQRTSVWAPLPSNM